MTRFAFYTDPHLMGRVPLRRIDNFPKTILTKIDEVYRIAKEENCDFVLMGGDLFNCHKIYSYDLMLEYLRILRDSNLKTYFVVGQHDLYGYEKDSYSSSALRFVSDVSESSFLPISDKIELDECIIYANHVYENVLEKAASIPFSEKFQIILAHNLLSQEAGVVFDLITTKSIPKTSANLILSGDLHSGVPYHEVNGTYFYNPGALARLSYSKGDISKVIKFAIFEIKKGSASLFGDYNIELKEHELKSARPAEEIFSKDAMEELKKASRQGTDINSFIKNMEQFEMEAVDIYHLLEMAGKQEGIDAVLLDYILKFREKLAGVVE